MKPYRWLGAAALSLIIAIAPVEAQRSRSSGSFSSSRSSFSSPSRPSYSPPSRPSYSSPSRPSSQSYGSSSGQKYSSPSQRQQQSSPASSGARYSSPSANSASRYSSPNSSAASSANQPRRSSYDAGAAAAMQRQQSARSFQAAKAQAAPASSYVDNTGKTRSIDPRDTTIRRLREDLSYQRYQTRQARADAMYSRYYANSALYPPRYYSDYYNPYLSYMLWDRITDHAVLALFLYNHRSTMDSVRYQEMLNRDADLQARVAALEAQNAPRDPNYVPNGIDRDLVYSDNYVQAAYNPESSSGFWKILGWCFLGGVGIWLVWFIFFRRPQLRPL